jgi:hypothetical protein
MLHVLPTSTFIALILFYKPQLRSKKLISKLPHLDTARAQFACACSTDMRIVLPGFEQTVQRKGQLFPTASRS